MSISTLNDDLNILQNLAIPGFEEDVDVIQKLDDEPNDVGGLTAAELKAKFDEAGNRIKTYINETLVPSISETVAEAEERAEAEAARVLAEEQRAAAEQERAAAEAEREQAEAERRAGEAARVSAEEERAAAETSRKEAEAARALAEQNRVDTDSGIVAQATSAAEAAENAANKAASAAIHQPIVGDNGNWHTWSFDAGAYVDTGIYAGGDAPYIGANGNWYVGQTDTGVSATSTGVYVGSGDMPEGYHLQIDPDGEETDIIPYIGSNGHWFLGDTDLNVSATGPIGPVGAKGDMGPQGPAGPALAVTNTAAVGQTVKITAVDENGQPTEWEAVDMAEQVQPDWNQNDSTQPDYVKNRTHYEESIYTDYVLNIGATEIVGLLLLEVGKTMTVKINGVESVETVKEAESSILGFSYKYIGNTDIDSLFNGGTGWIVAEASGQTMGFANPDTTITVGSIVVHKINDKFINLDRFAQTFDYYFKNYTIYKPLYKDDGSKCELYTCNNFILPKSDSQLFGFMGELGLSYVGRVNANSCFVGGAAISTTNGNINIKATVFGTSPTEMERIAADYGYTLTTKPNA